MSLRARIQYLILDHLRVHSLQSSQGMELIDFDHFIHSEKRLTAWLKMILRCKPIVERYYTPWSYVRKTGFEDAFRSLDKLGSLHFNLPVDLAVKQLQEIHEAF